MKSRQNNNIKNNNNLQPGRTNTFYRLSREKSGEAMCYLNIYIKVLVPYALNESCLVCKQTENG